MAIGATRRTLAVLLGTTAAVIVVDALSKHWALAHARTWPPLTPLPGIELTVTLNRGSAFGLGHGSPAAPFVLTTASVVLVGWLAWIAWRRRAALPAVAVPLGLALGGTLGNLADRTLRTLTEWGQSPVAAVVDFIVLRVGPHTRWPAFNAADAALVVGLPWLALALWHRERTPAP